MLRSPLRSPFVDLLRPSVGAAGLSIVQKAIGILRKYGTDAHVYLPGIGTVSGLTAGNYLNSAGTTAATVDNPVGLSLDALQAMTLGAQVVSDGGFDNPAAWNAGAGWSVTGGKAVATAASTGITSVSAQFVAGKTYHISVDVVVTSGAVYLPYDGAGANQQSVGTSGTYSYVMKAQGSNLYAAYGNVSFTGTVDNLSVREIPGIHATQATTANKPLLKQSGAKYYWQHDSTDLLTATYPAGYESATIIDAVTSGVVTNQGVNVVGAYSIGPSVNTAGRILMRTAPTAPELAVLQAYARSFI